MREMPCFPDKPGIMKIQGVSGNLFFKYGLREVFEAAFRRDMTEKPGKCEADNKKKARIAAVEFGLFDIGCPLLWGISTILLRISV